MGCDLIAAVGLFDRADDIGRLESGELVLNLGGRHGGDLTRSAAVRGSFSRWPMIRSRLLSPRAFSWSAVVWRSSSD